jgi:hypothetical protein
VVGVDNDITKRLKECTYLYYLFQIEYFTYVFLETKRQCIDPSTGGFYVSTFHVRHLLCTVFSSFSNGTLHMIHVLMSFGLGSHSCLCCRELLGVPHLFHAASTSHGTSIVTEPSHRMRSPVASQYVIRASYEWAFRARNMLLLRPFP